MFSALPCGGRWSFTNLRIHEPKSGYVGFIIFPMRDYIHIDMYISVESVFHVATG